MTTQTARKLEWVEKSRTSRFGKYQILHRVADGRRARFFQIFLGAVRRLKEKVSFAGIERTITRGIPDAQIAIPWEDLEQDLGHSYDRELRSTLNEAAVATESVLPRKLAGLRFDAVNPRSLEWASTKAAQLVTQVTEGTKGNIRNIITRSLEEGIPPRNSSKLIREVVGLTERQGNQVLRFVNRLTGEGVPFREAMKRAEKLSGTLLRRRALNIARTESITSANQGQQELWLQARDRGLIDQAATKRVFIVTPDDRLDSLICAPMANQKVGLEDPFITPQGVEVMVPAVHPQCRCAVVLEIPAPRITERPPRRRRGEGLPLPHRGQGVGPSIPSPFGSDIVNRVRQRQAQLLRNEGDYREVGADVYEEIRRRTPNVSNVDDMRRLVGTLRDDQQLARTGRDPKKWSDLQNRIAELEQRIFEAQAPIIREILSEIRPLGGVRHQWVRVAKDVRDAIDSVSEFLPRDWLERSRLSSSLTGGIVQRGFYSPSGLGKPARLNLSRRGIGAKGLRPVAFHEIGHRFEDTVSGISQLETEFYRRRTAAEASTWLGPGYGRNEVGKRDDFTVTLYNGKDYRSTTFYELLSVGQEAVFTGSYDIDRDPELRNLILGMLAAL